MPMSLVIAKRLRCNRVVKSLMVFGAYEVSERKIAQAEVIALPPAEAAADIPKMTLKEALRRFINGTLPL